MPSLRAQGVRFSFHDQAAILDGAAFHLEAGWTCLVGPNGAGKTTLLRLLARELLPTAGIFHFDPDPPLIHLCPQRVDEADETVEAFAAAWDGDAQRLRDELRLDPTDVWRWPSLSPGERKRWQVGAALARTPDVLLLDEPTNHLDADARALLVQALGRFRGVGVVVSHDRAFLEALGRRTLWLEGGAVELLPLPYGEARAAREQALQQTLAARSRAQAEQRALEKRLAAARHQQQQAVAQRSTGKRMRNRHDSDARTLGAGFLAEKAEKRIGRQVAVVRREAARAAAQVDLVELRKELGRSVFLGWEPPPRPVLLSREGPLFVGERQLLEETTLAVGRGDRIHLAGANGAGKSRLVEALLEAGHLPADKVLYLQQELSPEAGSAVLEEVRALPPEERGRVLSLVAALGLDPDRLLATGRPSPGEARKLRIARGMAARVWLLVLDEPTNHLDLPAIERLEAALVAWPGALLLVTHDEPLAAACTTVRWRLDGGTLRAS